MAVTFEGRVAVITGAGAGLGRSHALLLARRGAKVVVNDLGGAVDGTGNSTSAADSVVEEIRKAGGEAVANYDSVSDPAGAERIVGTAIDTFGRLDVLINNAGILRDKTFAKMPLEDFRTVCDVHFLGSVYCTSFAWPHMRENNYGRVVMTSSGAGLYGNFGQSNYGAAKMGVVGLMNVIKLEGARYNIRVNTVAPIAATRMTEALMPKHALPHLKSEYVSSAAAFLASEACDFSGHIISAGAGYFARAQMMESEGAFLEGEAAGDPDAVAAAYDRIGDLSTARAFESAEDYVSQALDRFKEPAESGAA
ncbi:SDR family oxidoreductase [Afifella sp. IM 167]|uniref:SDR family oxidoreductase n=1 Tax=Afifella sp. IM 167 TaxID=2033586 RepID=UPI001CCC726F|nr:SDR family oxidoreductase [Afifella sp. IM 167]MBZ8134790.1 3-oxoacyl-ACP reductase [Afifella sp. IM 167]